MTDALPPLNATPLAPRPDEWTRVRTRVRRRRTARTGVVSAAVVLAAAVPLTAGAQLLDGRELDRVQPPPVAGSLPGLQVHDGPPLGREHVRGDLDYPEQDVRPPTGGDHAPAPQTCGVYAAPVADENAVHSLEHGAVWITYRPDLDPAGVARLRETIDEAAAYGLLSPRQQASPVVVSAWERQLEVERADDPALAAFVEEFTEGQQTPEPGARCDGESGVQLAAGATPVRLPACAGTTSGFDILTEGRPDGPTPEQAAAAYAARPGNGASVDLPPDGWELLRQTADLATVVSGPAHLELFRSQGGWAVTGGGRCATG